MLLVDVSGSMRNTLGPPASPVRGFLAQNLLSSSLFTAGQPASLYGFTVAGRQTRECQGGFDRAQLEKRLVDGLPITHEDTDLVYVLQMIENEVRRTPKSAVTLAWIITDNVNDPHGAGADAKTPAPFTVPCSRGLTHPAHVLLPAKGLQTRGLPTGLPGQTPRSTAWIRSASKSRCGRCRQRCGPPTSAPSRWEAMRRSKSTSGFASPGRIPGFRLNWWDPALIYIDSAGS